MAEFPYALSKFLDQQQVPDLWAWLLLAPDSPPALVEERLSERKRWAEQHIADPIYGEEALFVILHEQAIHEELRRTAPLAARRKRLRLPQPAPVDTVSEQVRRLDGDPEEPPRRATARPAAARKVAAPAAPAKALGRDDLEDRTSTDVTEQKAPRVARAPSGAELLRLAARNLESGRAPFEGADSPPMPMADEVTEDREATGPITEETLIQARPTLPGAQPVQLKRLLDRDTSAFRASLIPGREYRFTTRPRAEAERALPSDPTFDDDDLRGWEDHNPTLTPETRALRGLPPLGSFADVTEAVPPRPSEPAARKVRLEPPTPRDPARRRPGTDIPSRPPPADGAPVEPKSGRVEPMSGRVEPPPERLQARVEPPPERLQARVEPPPGRMSARTEPPPERLVARAEPAGPEAAAGERLEARTELPGASSRMQARIETPTPAHIEEPIVERFAAVPREPEPDDPVVAALRRASAPRPDPFRSRRPVEPRVERAGADPAADARGDRLGRSEPPPHLRTEPPLHLRSEPPPHLRTEPPLHLRSEPPPHLRTEPPLHLRTEPPLHLRSEPPPHLRSEPVPGARSEPPAWLRSDALSTPDAPPPVAEPPVAEPRAPAPPPPRPRAGARDVGVAARPMVSGWLLAAVGLMSFLAGAGLMYLTFHVKPPGFGGVPMDPDAEERPAGR